LPEKSRRRTSNKSGIFRIPCFRRRPGHRPCSPEAAPAQAFKHRRQCEPRPGACGLATSQWQSSRSAARHQRLQIKRRVRCHQDHPMMMWRSSRQELRCAALQGRSKQSSLRIVSLVLSLEEFRTGTEGKQTPISIDTLANMLRGGQQPRGEVKENKLLWGVPKMRPLDGVIDSHAGSTGSTNMTKASATCVSVLSVHSPTVAHERPIVHTRTHTHTQHTPHTTHTHTHTHTHTRAHLALRPRQCLRRGDRVSSLRHGAAAAAAAAIQQGEAEWSMKMLAWWWWWSSSSSSLSGT
jgi:hypothetical protein